MPLRKIGRATYNPENDFIQELPCKINFRMTDNRAFIDNHGKNTPNNSDLKAYFC